MWWTNQGSRAHRGAGCRPRAKEARSWTPGSPRRWTASSRATPASRGPTRNAAGCSQIPAPACRRPRLPSRPSSGARIPACRWTPSSTWPPGSLFVVRVAAHVLDDSTVGSLEFAADYLGVPLIVVMGHDDCRAIRATVEQTAGPGSIGTIMDAIEPSVLRARNRGTRPEDLVAEATRGTRQGHGGGASHQPRAAPAGGPRRPGDQRRPLPPGGRCGGVARAVASRASVGRTAPGS